MAVVCLIPCDSYDESVTYEAIKKGFELLGGVQKYIHIDGNVLLKPNLLSGATPEKAVTTHPAVFGAVAKFLREEGVKNLNYGDSSGVGAPSAEKVVITTGLEKEAAKYGITHKLFDKSVSVHIENAKVAKNIVLCKDAVEADSIISLCKMKTHALETITGALKNQYGTVYGSQKGLYHAKYPTAGIFGDMIADLNTVIRPKLFIMDAIVAMEGNGPASGDPVNMNMILMSDDGVALDTVFSELIYLPPENVPTTVSAFKAGLGTMRKDEIQIYTPEGIVSVEQAKSKYGNPDFKVSRKKTHFWNPKATILTLRRQSEKPVVDLSKCIACGICEEACPVDEKAVHSGNGQKAKYDYSKCIRCYCCQEMCPAKAIEKK